MAWMPDDACTTHVIFPHLTNTPVIVDFTGGHLTSDAGFLFLRQVDERLGLSRRLAGCLIDRRDPAKVRHGRNEQFSQRLYQIACGYEDCNDADFLRGDPALKIAVGRLPESGEDLSSQPTLSRFENGVRERELKRMNRELLAVYQETRPAPGKTIVIDLDATDDPTHGQQAFSFYHGYFRQHMFHPLLCFDGESGDLPAADLRPGNVHAAKVVVKPVNRVVKKIRRRWPGVEIVIRADAGFCVPRLYRFCEHNGLGYVLGLITNKTLKGLHAPLLQEAEALYEEGGTKARLLGEVGYRARIGAASVGWS